MANTTLTTKSLEGNTLFPIVLSIVARRGDRRAMGLRQPDPACSRRHPVAHFAFLPPLVGILLGWKSGFICGYLGSLVWSLLAGTFIPAHASSSTASRWASPASSPA